MRESEKEGASACESERPRARESERMEERTSESEPCREREKARVGQTDPQGHWKNNSNNHHRGKNISHSVVESHGETLGFMEEEHTVAVSLASLSSRFRGTSAHETCC